MKIFRVSVLLVLFLLLPLSLVFAEGHKGHKGKRMGLEIKVSKMQRKLDLSDDQADQIYDLMKSKRKIGACKDLEKFSERKNCRRSVREKVDQQIAALLTPDQQAKFAEMKEKRKERRKKGRRDH